MSAWITTHHEDCDGDDCDYHNCAMLPENIGQFREGEVLEVRDGGREVDIEWSDGTKSTLRKRKPPTPPPAPKCANPQCTCNLTKQNGEWTQ